ncbi:cytidine deaminase [Fimbriimonadia bacterium ATM]|nr:MAG: cytidine deaminase [Armatimonadota bacterium]MBC6969475.1 cytidine deaminase [Armatimonadota bacterium]MCE7899187.1 cytidine deaminase [Armatimonadetes bacterium ATM1]MDL1928970.1 cytidine deaminase [Fimbriimonadia bacterium ATM]RIJ97252.1 MAG: cytidine deaminase [Armatimonadota bacterium]
MNDALIQAAIEARQFAYAPYSEFRVGAAVEAAGGEVFTGCNVENASIGLTTCAERNAIAAMIRGGETKWTRIAIATENGARPCGACLQVLQEFASDPAQCRAILIAGETPVADFKFVELLPHPFESRG